MKQKTAISAIVIAKNEEENISECLESLSWADEVVVVDTGSRDKTVKIAKLKGARVFRYTRGGYSDWRNEGLLKARGEWILYVDADERVSRNLRSEIVNYVLSKKFNDEKVVTYAIPRENIILGKKMVHGGWWPDYVKRLFKRKFLRGWVGDLHEEPVFNGRLSFLNSPFLHIKHDNLSDMVDKTNRWSEIEARLMFESGHPKMNIFRFLSAISREFFLRMIKYKAFLDGPEGIIYALYQVFSRFVSYAKLWEMQLDSKK